jgi:hypothetical protein
VPAARVADTAPMRPPALREPLVALVPFVPAILVGGVLAWWEHTGAFYPEQWYPGAVFLLLLAGVACVAQTDLLRALGRRVRWAAVALAAYGIWSFASIAWAVDKGDAWDGANRTLLYGTVFLLLSLVPWTGRAALAALAVVVAVTTAVGVDAVDRAANAADPLDSFVKGRLAAPMGYTNATACLLLSVFWVAVGLAARRRAPFALRAAMLACAGALLGVALLCQSRGGALTFPVIAVVFFAVARDRLRCLLALLVVGGVVALNSRPLLDVFRGLEADRDPRLLLDRAQHGLVLIFVELLAAGALWALVDARWRLPARVTTWTGRIILNVAVIALVGGAIAAVVVPAPRHRIDRSWHQFTANELPVDGANHFSSGLGSNRYDFWRVAAHEFRRHPANGVGVDNFAIDYVRERRSDEEPLYPHSLELRVVAQTGVIGALLLGAFLVLSTLAGLSGRRLGNSDASAAAALALMPFFDWLLHGSADWFWEFPPLGLLGIGGVAVAGALGTRHERIVRNRPRVALSVVTVSAAAALFLAVLASLALPLAAQRFVRAATEQWRSDPSRARTSLQHARSLNPLSEQPDLVGGAIAARLKAWPWMNSALREAIRRDPQDWYSHFELGLVEDVQGNRAGAVVELHRAHDLNPREPLVLTALDEIAGGRRVSVAKYDELLVERNDALAR